MSLNQIGWLVFSITVLGAALVSPDLAMAYDFAGRTQAFTSNLIGTILPLLSTLGVVYAVILALTGDGGAKARIITVAVCSVVGFLAPHFIQWLKVAAGS